MSARLVIYAVGVSDEQELERLAEEIADVLSGKQGSEAWRASFKDRDSDSVLGVIAAEAWAMPDDDDEMVKQIGATANWILLPGDDEAEAEAA